MVKAKEFWDYLCGTLRYRFFAGVICNELKPLYSTMSSDFMHYIPAVNERTALGVASGVVLTGIKSGILISINNIYDILQYYNEFNCRYRIPCILILGYKNEDQLSILKQFKISYKILTSDYVKDLKSISDKLDSTKYPRALVIKEGILK